MIQFHHVSKAYPPDSAALTDITLEIDNGEFVFLTGPSGAGKTTLLRLLFRDEEPSQGEISLNGQNIGRLKSRGVARLRRRIGLVFQEFKLLPRLSALENVALAAEVIGVPRKESYNRAYRLLSELGMQKKSDARPLALSGGEQQRVAIARALVNEPQVLLADEPTGNLDERATRGVFQLLRDINASGTAVVLATHDLEMVRAAPYRVIELQEGAIVYDSAVDEPAAGGAQA